MFRLGGKRALIAVAGIGIGLSIFNLGWALAFGAFVIGGAILGSLGLFLSYRKTYRDLQQARYEFTGELPELSALKHWNIPQEKIEALRERLQSEPEIIVGRFAWFDRLHEPGDPTKPGAYMMARKRNGRCEILVRKIGKTLHSFLAEVDALVRLSPDSNFATPIDYNLETLVLHLVPVPGHTMREMRFKLRDELREKGLPRPNKVELLLQAVGPERVAMAKKLYDKVHERGVCVCDVHPGNLIIRSDRPELCMIDFDRAKTFAQVSSPVFQYFRSRDTRDFTTQFGSTNGTPAEAAGA